MSDIESLRATLKALKYLPPVIGSEGDEPAVVRVEDVRPAIRRASGVVDQIAARLDRYERLKRYSRELAAVVTAQSATIRRLKLACAARDHELDRLENRLAAIQEIAAHGFPGEQQR